MTLRFKYIIGLAALAAGLVSCVKEDFENAANGSYEGIQFNISTADTKTVYGEQATDKSWPLYWVAGDPIRIYCAEAEDAKQADYTVTPSGSNSNTGSMALASGSTALQWGGDSNDHNFYAVYPNTATIEDGIVTFQINRNQKATVTTTNGYDDDVVATPDMTNAYMVAKTTTKPTDDAVGLTFKPIMTTLDVVITAADVSMNTTGSARITGISLASTMTSNSTASKDQFYYDITNEAITANGASTSGTSTTMTEQTFVNLVDASGNASYVDLASGHTLTITIFLPPMSKAAAANLKRQVKVRVHATGNTELVASLKTNDAATENWTTQLTPGTKRRIVLPALPTDAQYSGNNWITPLDGDIYVSQMSIPGTHDAATGDGTSFSLGKTQDIDIEGQWEMGIRAFDIRPREGSNDDSQLYYGNSLWINHGAVSTTWSMDAIVKTFKTYLEANPGEFAIIIMRHETEGDSDSESWADTMADALNDYASLTNETTGKGLTINFKPDLTIDECRGKILFMMRSWTPYTGGPTVGGYHGWSHVAAAVKTEIWGPESDIGTLYIQDYYNIDLGFTIWPDYDITSHENIFKKQNTLCDMLEISAKSHTDDTFKNTWFINHTSGYLYYTIGDAGVSTTAGYRYNARNNHPVVYNFITNNTVTINGTTRTRPTGSTGIILMDFVGAATSDGVAVQGDLCPQAIIDNNYKYRMKRKGE